MSNLLQSPLFAVTITFVAYFAAKKAYDRFTFFWLNPVLIAVAALIALLRLLGIDYETYHQGGRVISFFLGPAVVALGVPLYRQMEEIRRRGWSLAVSIPAGAAVGILSAAGLARILGATPEVIASLAPKSTTTPISMGIAEKIGGIPPLTAALVIAAGILGAAIGPAFLRLIRVRSKTAFGLAIGAAAHGVGTARALEEGELEGAASGLAIGLTGIATAVLTPILIGLFK